MTGAMVLCGSLSRSAVTLGAAMHEAGYAALGLRWRYMPFEVSDLRGSLTGMRALGIRGFGVSMPFKQEIAALCDELDPLARRIGAVNTVVNDDGRLVGHNTDCIGAVRALSEALTPTGARILVLGAGGAARAVAHGLVDAGARLTLSNRSDARAAALAGELGAEHLPWRQRAKLERFDAVVNATAQGMEGIDSGSPLPESALASLPIVMDIVYKPLDTALVMAARGHGAVVLHGGRMLLHQAARQFELYTGRPAPLEAMDAALQAEIGAPQT